MSAWLVDRALPGIFSGGLMTIAVAVSHLLLRRHVTRTADRQGERIDRLTAAQTATLTGGAPEIDGGTTMTAEAPVRPAAPEETSPDPRGPHFGPHFGFTRHGLAVHMRTTGHLAPAAGDNWYARFNKRTAQLLADRVGTMTCFWIFNLLSFALLAPTLSYDGLFGAPKSGFLHWYLSYGFIILWTFLLSTYIQLVLLPGLMVGQALQNIAADARAAKTFEDVERVLDALDLKTEGGLAVLLAAVNRIPALIDAGASAAAKSPPATTAS